MTRPPLPPAIQPVPQWQTIYCSLMLLLVVFFVMLIAYSAVDKDRFQQIKKVAHKEPTAPGTSPDIQQAMQSMRQLNENLGIDSGCTVVRTEDGFKAVVPNPVLFASGDASLGGATYPILDGIVKIAERDHLSIQVEGHTDNLPIRTEKFPSNWELATMRAVSILRYLNQKGIPSERLAAVGFSEYRPVASNGTPEGRQRNRRIEILFRTAR
jgi:chemotaxis protein MotB